METTKNYNGRTYVYNHDKAMIEWRDEELGTLESYGLSNENFDENPDYWFEVFHNRIEEELANLAW